MIVMCDIGKTTFFYLTIFNAIFTHINHISDTAVN